MYFFSTLDLAVQRGSLWFCSPVVLDRSMSLNMIPYGMESWTCDIAAVAREMSRLCSNQKFAKIVKIQNPKLPPFVCVCV